MDRNEAFKYINDALTRPEPDATQYANREQYKTDKAKYDATLKGAVVAGVVILEDVLQDFKKIANALAEVNNAPRSITYAGPRPFRIVGNLAETFDPAVEAGQASLFDNKV